MTYNWKLLLAGKELDTENGLIGWDPLKKQLVDWHWDQAGNRCEGTVEITDEKITRTFDMVSPVGKVLKSGSQVWIERLNTLYLQYTKVDANGQMQPSGEPLIFTRIYD
jgi:hypothetical protein